VCRLRQMRTPRRPHQWAENTVVEGDTVTIVIVRRCDVMLSALVEMEAFIDGYSDG